MGQYVGQLEVMKKPVSKTMLEGLRVRAARVHPMINRLQAEAELEYGQRKNSLTYVTGYHQELNTFVEEATDFLNGLSDEEADLGIVGNFSLEEAERRRDLFDKIVEKKKAQRELRKRAA